MDYRNEPLAGTGPSHQIPGGCEPQGEPRRYSTTLENRFYGESNPAAMKPLDKDTTAVDVALIEMAKELLIKYAPHENWNLTAVDFGTNVGLAAKATLDAFHGRN